MNGLHLKVGDKCMAFDSNSWRKTGDIGDNSCYWKESEIIAERSTDEFAPRQIVDVKFIDGSISHGHFKTHIKSI